VFVSLVGVWLINTRVERGIVRALGGHWDRLNSYFPTTFARLPANVTEASFRAAANRVAGWDLLVVLDPYGSGSDVMNDPLLATQGPELQAAVRDLEGFPNDGIYGIFVIRGGRIVENFWLDGPFMLGGVIVRAK
jgi:hypothetical protein